MKSRYSCSLSYALCSGRALLALLLQLCVVWSQFGSSCNLVLHSPALPWDFPERELGYVWQRDLIWVVWASRTSPGDPRETDLIGLSPCFPQSAGHVTPSWAQDVPCSSTNAPSPLPPKHWFHKLGWRSSFLEVSNTQNPTVHRNITFADPELRLDDALLQLWPNFSTMSVKSAQWAALIPLISSCSDWGKALLIAIV